MLPKLSTNRHISRFLAAHPNHDSVLREATIHQRQEWRREITDGLGPKDPYNATLERFQTQGGRESRLSLTDGTEREIIIAVMGVSGNAHTYPKSAVYLLRPLLDVGKSYFIREVSGIWDIEVSNRLDSCKIFPGSRMWTQLLTEIRYQNPTLLFSVCRCKNNASRHSRFQ